MSVGGVGRRLEGGASVNHVVPGESGKDLSFIPRMMRSHGSDLSE